MPHRTDIRRAIEALRELVQLAISDIESKLGGPLGFDAQNAVRAWLARSFEAGRDANPSLDSSRRIVTYLEKHEQLLQLTSRGMALEAETEALWRALTPDEQKLAVEMRRDP